MDRASRRPNCPHLFLRKCLSLSLYSDKHVKAYVVLKFAGTLRIKIEMGEIKTEDNEILKIPCGALGPSHMYISQTTSEIALVCKET